MFYQQKDEDKDIQHVDVLPHVESFSEDTSFVRFNILLLALSTFLFLVTFLPFTLLLLLCSAPLVQMHL